MTLTKGKDTVLTKKRDAHAKGFSPPFILPSTFLFSFRPFSYSLCLALPIDEPDKQLMFSLSESLNVCDSVRRLGIASIISSPSICYWRLRPKPTMKWWMERHSVWIIVWCSRIIVRDEAKHPLSQTYCTQLIRNLILKMMANFHLFLRIQLLFHCAHRNFTFFYD